MYGVHVSGAAMLFALLLLAANAASAQTKLLRFPDIHGDRVVFAYGGDLWTASVQHPVKTIK